MAKRRQYRGISKYNYYRLKQDRYVPELGRHLSAGTKMLYWAAASHSTQHIQTTYFYVTTNPEDSKMVRIPIRAKPWKQSFRGPEAWGCRTHPTCQSGMLADGFVRPLKVFARISMRPDKGAKVGDSEVRSKVMRGGLWKFSS